MKYLCFLITYLSICSGAPSLKANSRDHRRIVGGDEADIKDFPYIGALLVKGQQSCGAALISYDTAVTAAHCLVHRNIHRNITDLSLRFGSSQWKSGGEEISVKQVIIHPKYPTLRPDYDIAVVKLNRNVNVANAVPIPLAAQGSQYLDGTLGVVSGWGMTEAGRFSKTLRAVEVPVYDQTQCRDAYGGNTITNRMICAGYKEGGKDSCSQDSGGPYVINGELVGIVSVGKGCASPAYPGVYASVPAFHDWIKLHA